jgi:formamidopyrimidine-DNA glycosylase
MPELPEVEVTRRGLAPFVVGRTVESVAVRDARLRWPVPRDLDAAVAGKRVEQLERRGKYLLWRFEHGTLISHLGMSGVWRVWSRAAVPEPQRHDHVDVVLASHLIRLTDPRRFGALLWHRAEEGPVARHPLLAGLGIEPFDPRFDGALLHRETRRRSAAIKQVLLAGDIVVGVGNIYASEAPKPLVSAAAR